MRAARLASGGGEAGGLPPGAPVQGARAGRPALRGLAQLLLGALLRSGGHSLAARARFRLLRLARRGLLALDDPLVTYELDGATLRLPLSHELPLYRRAHPAYASNVGRIARLVAAKYPDLTLIDIGANVGDTAALVLRLTDCPILCIEGHPAFFAILQGNAERLGPRIHLERSFVHSCDGQLSAAVEAGAGTACLVEGGGRQVATKSLSRILAEHPLFARAKMIKIDTDGLDGRILRSEAALLARLRPVVLFEYVPALLRRYGDDGLSLFACLREQGYRRAVFYENSGVYLLTATLGDEPLLRDLHEGYLRAYPGRYADVCAFHGEDDDLCAALREAELRFFGRRGANGSGG